MINIQWTKFEQKSIVTFISEELPEALKVNQIITFSSIQMNLLLCFAYMVIFKTQNKRRNNIQKTSPQSYKT